MITSNDENFEPVGNNVLIKKDVVKVSNAGDIIIPEIAKGAAKVGYGTGEIISLGTKMESNDLKVGDKIMFQHIDYNPTLIMHNCEATYIYPTSDIICKIVE